MSWFDVLNDFNTQVLEGPIVVAVWVNWLTLTSFASLIWVLRRRVATVVAAAMLLNVFLLMYVFATYGMVRLLGAVHFAFMAPAVVYAWGQLQKMPKDEWHTKWVRVFGATWTISLWIDAIDVIRYIAGDRSPVG